MKFKETSRILDLFVVRNFKLIPVFLYSLNFFTARTVPPQKMNYIKYYPTTFSQIYVGVNILWHLRCSNFFTRLKDVVFDFFPVPFILTWNYINAHKIANILTKKETNASQKWNVIYFIFISIELKKINKNEISCVIYKNVSIKRK